MCDYANFKAYRILNSWMRHYRLLLWIIVQSQEVQVSGCLHIRSFHQLKPITVAFTSPTMLDINDAVFWTFSILLPGSPSKRCICRCSRLILVTSKSNLENFAQKCARRNRMCSLRNTNRCTGADDSTIQNHLFHMCDWCSTAVCIRTNSRSARKLRCNSLMHTEM